MRVAAWSGDTAPTQIPPPTSYARRGGASIAYQAFGEGRYGTPLAGRDILVIVTRDEAMIEVERRRAADPQATWVATERDGDWTVARIGIAPIGQTGTATKPPPAAPRDDPHSSAERAAWFAAGG